MAEQSNLTIGGIGSDPSGTHPTGYLDKYWAESIDGKSVKYLPSSLTIMDDPGATAADETDTYYSKEVSVLGPPHGLIFSTPASGQAEIRFCWEWYNSKDGGFDSSGNWTGGTWTNVYALSENAGADQLTPGDADEELVVAKASKFRVKMEVKDAGGGVLAGLVTTAVDALNHVANGASLSIPFDREALSNKPMVAAYAGQSTSGSIGGLGVDPS